MIERERQFREVCSTYATGVTIILTRVGQDVQGMTANAFMSVSLDPLLVAVAIGDQSRMFTALCAPAKAFTISVLNGDQQWVSETFSGRRGKPHQAIDYWMTDDGLPIIADALSYLVCERRELIVAGDHGIILAEVKNWGHGDARTPLLFYRSAYYSPFNRDGLFDDLLLLER